MLTMKAKFLVIGTYFFLLGARGIAVKAAVSRYTRKTSKDWDLLKVSFALDGLCIDMSRLGRHGGVSRCTRLLRAADDEDGGWISWGVSLKI